MYHRHIPYSATPLPLPPQCTKLHLRTTIIWFKTITSNVSSLLWSPIHFLLLPPVLLHSTYWGMVVESLWWVGGKDGWMAHSNSTAQFHTQCLLMTVYIYTTPSHRHRPLGILKYPHLYSSYVVCLTCCCCCSPPLVLHPLSYDHRETIRLATSFPCPTDTTPHPSYWYGWLLGSGGGCLLMGHSKPCPCGLEKGMF